MLLLIMKIFKNLFGNGSKIDANEIAYSDGKLALDDTGWVDLTFEAPFLNYGGANGTRPRIRRIGSIVTLIGVATASSLVGASASTNIIKGIPDEFRPTTTNINFPRMQGSGQNTWMMQYDNGNFVISRYGVASPVDIPSGAWLPFIVTYFV